MKLRKQEKKPVESTGEGRRKTFRRIANLAKRSIIGAVLGVSIAGIILTSNAILSDYNEYKDQTQRENKIQQTKDSLGDTTRSIKYYFEVPKNDPIKLYLNRLEDLDSIKDTRTGAEYIGSQKLLVEGNWVNTSMRVAKFSKIVYTSNYSGDQFVGDGIPLCSYKNYKIRDSLLVGSGACKYYGGDMAYATENHRVIMRLLGRDWVILEMDNIIDTGQGLPRSLDPKTYSGSLLLGKEKGYGQLNQKGYLMVDGLKFVFVDFDRKSQYAKLEVLNAKGKVVESAKIYRYQKKKISIPGFGEYILFASGFLTGYDGVQGITPILSLSVLSDYMRLNNGEELVLNGKIHPWQVRLGWINQRDEPVPYLLNEIDLRCTLRMNPSYYFSIIGDDLDWLNIHLLGPNGNNKGMIAITPTTSHRAMEQLKTMIDNLQSDHQIPLEQIKIVLEQLQLYNQNRH
ncbi:MAG: hypothetical protein WC501_00380 [Candidatus Micrarchaeia archaeon]